MQYRKFGNLEISVSALGFGCMRLPVTDPKDGSTIDEPEATRMIRHAIDEGVNYIDTAYPYHGGESERVVGRALKDGYREKVYLATKLPIWFVSKAEDFDRYLDEQLEKLQTDHIDFYLLHALDAGRLETVRRLNLVQKLEQAKAAGKIRYAGFSFHDSLSVFKEIVDLYDHWDFCQIQYNYINTDYQAGTEGLRYAAERGLGVVIMEPLLGGKLVNITDPMKDAMDPSRKPVEWALDWLWNQPEVSVILSGMSSMEQVEDNLAIASRSSVGMLSAADLDMLAVVKDVYEHKALVPCTGCAYCMPCPFGLEIPAIFDLYNQSAVRRFEKVKADYEKLAIRADSCRKCHRCEKECPQHIRISEVMTQVAEKFA